MSYNRPIAADSFVDAPRSAPHVAFVAPESLGRRVTAALRRGFALWARVQTQRATARALARLNDHQLKDIGIERGSIPEIAYATAWAQLTAAGLDHPNGLFDSRRDQP